MGNYTIFLKFENLRRGRQARNLSENDPKILGLKSSSEQIILRKLSLGAPSKPRAIIVLLWLLAKPNSTNVNPAKRTTFGTVLRSKKVKRTNMLQYKHCKKKENGNDLRL